MVDLVCVLAFCELPVEQRNIFVRLVFQHLWIMMMRMIIILVELIFHVYNLYFSENICMPTSTLSPPFLCIFLSETFARPPRHLPRHQFHFLTLQLQSRVEQPGGKFVHIICDVYLYLYLYSCLVFIHCHRQCHPELFDLHFRALLQFALCQNSKTQFTLCRQNI